MLKFFATLAGVVLVVWCLSIFAAPALPSVEGHDATPVDDPPVVAKARGKMSAHEVSAVHVAKDAHEEKVEKFAKGKKGGKGRRG